MTDPAVIEVPTRRFDDARLAWVAILVLLVNVVSLPSGWPYWLAVALRVLAAAVVGMAVYSVHRSSHGRPVRATPTTLQIPVDDDAAVEIDWADIAAGRVARRFLQPCLTVEPVDPDRLRPAPDRWRRLAGTGADGRYRIEVPLGGSRASRARLGAELTARIPERASGESVRS